MSGAASAHQFVHDPGAWADPSLVAALIAPGLLPQTASRLMSCERTGRRASALLAHTLGEANPGLGRQDQEIATAPAMRLQRIANAAGAVCHAGRVRALVRGADIAALAARIGPDARAAALQHTPPAAAPLAATDDLAADIAAAGAACIAAWLAELPPWAAARLRLAHPWPDAPASPAPGLAALVRLVAAATL